jgi:hypothetical protein
MRSRLALAAALGALLACGGSGPSSPSASLNLAGTWSGSWVFVTSGVTVTDSVMATLTQSGTDVNGTWTALSGASGQFTHLTPSASTSGTLSISQPTIAGPACTATTTVTGSATASTLELTVAPIAASGICQWAIGQQFSLAKQ